MKIRSGYNYDRDAASARVALRCSDPSLARQEMKDEADINTIVRNFGVTGKVTMPSKLPTYGDFEDIFDFRTAMQSVREAEKAFESIPAKVRNRFGNDPQAFVEFCSDPANLPELISLGLAPAKDAPATLVPVPKENG